MKMVKVESQMGARGSAEANGRGSPLDLGVHHRFNLEARDAGGNLKWMAEIDNLVVNVGLNYLLDVGYGGATQSTLYVGLTDGTPTVASTDTMALHTGWTEISAYTEATRQLLTMAAAASQSCTNAASKYVFSINADSTTIGGAFVATDSTKGAGGTVGVLVGAGAFTAADKSLDSGDTLNVTITASGTSS